MRTKLLVDSVDAYVLGMESPVNRQKRCLHPVVKERQSLVAQLQSILRDLGLERRTKTHDIAAELAALHLSGAQQPSHSLFRGTEGKKHTSLEGGEGGASSATKGLEHSNTSQAVDSPSGEMPSSAGLEHPGPSTNGAH